jgi:glutamate-1-semialdehyde 2,1-aminomutase
MDRMGTALRAGIVEQASTRAISINYTGPAAMPYLTFAGDRDHQLGSVFAAAAIRAGLYLHPRHNWFISAAMTDADLAKALAATDEAFAAVQARLEGGIT